MRKVKHPEKLYIWLREEGANTMSMSFSDNKDGSYTIDPNAFDKESKERLAMLMWNAYKFVVNHINNGEGAHGGTVTHWDLSKLLR